MKKLVVVIVLVVALVAVAGVSVMVWNGGDNWFTSWFGGTVTRHLCEARSPDGRSVAVLLEREKHGPFRGPEPPETQGRWVRLRVARDGKTIYDSGYESLSVYGTPVFALDLAWSPNSRHLAYRHVGSLRIIGRDGKTAACDAVPHQAVISSFRWIDDDRLLIVAKETDKLNPLAMPGLPDHYGGYSDRAEVIHITRLNVVTGETNHYEQAMNEAKGADDHQDQAAKMPGLSNKPTFLFHAIGFLMDEISPNADRVAFSDSGALCIYDDATGKVIARAEIPQRLSPPADATANSPNDIGESTESSFDAAKMIAAAEKLMASMPAQIDGIWWQTNDRLVIGVGMLSSQPNRYAFFTYDVPSNVLSDQSNVLLPLWMGNNTVRNYQDPDWFRSAIR